GIKRNFEIFDPLEWLAAITAQIPDKGAHMIRYYGYYSNKSRGMRKKSGKVEDTPLRIESQQVSSVECRLRWANLIKKIYEIDPLICPACGGQMKIISFIQEREVIEKILNHLGLLDQYTHSPPQKIPSTEIRYEPFYDDFPVYD
ncbi:MAG: transposase, partial [Candidatus Desantisbacteria bacterium]